MALSKLTGFLKTLLPIMLGTAIYAFGLLYFILPNQLMEGGVTGVTLLLNYAFGISPSLSNLLLNIPLFLIGWKILGGRSILWTGVGIGSLTLFLWLFEQMIDHGWILPFETQTDYPRLVICRGDARGRAGHRLPLRRHHRRIGYCSPDSGPQVRVQHGTGHPDAGHHHYRVIALLY